jgi:hypothetical protein
MAPLYPKATQYAHFTRTRPGQTVTFSATPYEAVSFPKNQTPSLGGGYVWDNYGTSSVRFEPGGSPRPDLRLISGKGSGMGATFTHQTKGKGYNYSQFWGNRSLATEMFECMDAGDSTWRCLTSGIIANSIVIPDGVTSHIGVGGLDTITLQSATPDYFLGNLSLPQMTYILAAPANKERRVTYDLAMFGFDTSKPWPTPLPVTPIQKKNNIQAYLGYLLQGTGPTGMAVGDYQDPLQGLGNYRNQYNSTINQLMQPVAANEFHFFSSLSSSRVAVEIMNNHVKANGHAIKDVFGMEILVGSDIERDLLTFDTSGSINSIMQDMARHGVWLVYWDTRAGFHFVPHYYWGGGYPISAVIASGPSLVGDLEISPASPNQRMSGVGVKGQGFLTFGDAGLDALSTNVNANLGAVYPPGGDYGQGEFYTMDDYMGRNCGVQAQRLFNLKNARTRFKWSNIPYPTLVTALFNKAVAITATDPNGNYSYNGKPFWVTDFDIQLEDPERPGNGVYNCSISGVEI